MVEAQLNRILFMLHVSERQKNIYRLRYQVFEYQISVLKSYISQALITSTDTHIVF